MKASELADSLCKDGLVEDRSRLVVKTLDSGAEAVGMTSIDSSGNEYDIVIELVGDKSGTAAARVTLAKSIRRYKELELLRYVNRLNSRTVTGGCYYVDSSRDSLTLYLVGTTIDTDAMSVYRRLFALKSEADKEFAKLR